MRGLFMYLKTATGWKPISSDTLDSISVKWGTDSPYEQPDPAVLDFTIRDRQRKLYSNALSLIGASVLVQLSPHIRWQDLRKNDPYHTVSISFADYASKTLPTAPLSDDKEALCLFSGFITTGGTVVRKSGADYITLSATARSVLYARMQDNGPSIDAAGDHWQTDPEKRLQEIQRRVRSGNMPPLDTNKAVLPLAVSSYEANDHVSLKDVLTRLFAADPAVPVWNEVPGLDSSSKYTCVKMAQPVSLTADSNGVITPDNGQALDTGTVKQVSEWKLNAPLTDAVIKGKSAKPGQDGSIEYGDAQISVSASDLPVLARQTQKSVTFETDAVIDPTTTAFKATSITYAGRANLSDALNAYDSTPIPSELDIDSLSDAPEWAYRACMSGAYTHTGINAPEGAWTTIGGTVSYKWKAGQPVLSAALSVAPLPVADNNTRWRLMSAWTMPYKLGAFSFDALSRISEFTE